MKELTPQENIQAFLSESSTLSQKYECWFAVIDGELSLVNVDGDLVLGDIKDDGSVYEGTITLVLSG
jgi:hypothetical protein